MPVRQLPDHPSIEQYKKQAKELLKAWKAGDAGALARISEFHPHFSKASDARRQRATLTLADAQFVVARERMDSRVGRSLPSRLKW